MEGMVYWPPWEDATQSTRGNRAFWSGWSTKATAGIFAKKSKIAAQRTLFADAFSAFGIGSATLNGELMH